MAVPTAGAARRGTVSTRNSAMPRLTGTAMSMRDDDGDHRAVDRAAARRTRSVDRVPGAVVKNPSPKALDRRPRLSTASDDQDAEQHREHDAAEQRATTRRCGVPRRRWRSDAAVAAPGRVRWPWLMLGSDLPFMIVPAVSALTALAAVTPPDRAAAAGPVTVSARPACRRVLDLPSTRLDQLTTSSGMRHVVELVRHLAAPFL